MDDKRIKVLLIENNPSDARLIQEMLKEVETDKFEVGHVDKLSTGLERLAKDRYDVLLLDLGLPDSKGIETLERALVQAQEVPIIVLTGLADETVGIKAVQRGAQDYLVKGPVDSNLLTRSIRYAIERKRMEIALRNLSLRDELTGLYNRRGFFALAQQQLKLANRTNRGLLLVVADLDGLKKINDTFGHEEGDLALMETANILKETFRESDVIGRIGGDEFAVTVIEDNKATPNIIAARFQHNLDIRNVKGNRRYKLSISKGIARCDPRSSCFIDKLIAQADALMYEQKRGAQKK